MSDIFVSYTSRDRRAVERLVDALQRQQPGWSIWWDREIGPGRRIDAAIRNELDTAGCVVVVWSRAALESDWVQSEAEQGRMRNVLIPVKLDDVDPPMPFERIKSALLKNWSGELDHPGFQQLVASIAAQLDQPPPPPVPVRGWWARYRRLRPAMRYAIATVAGLALAGTGIYAYRTFVDAAPSGMVLIPGGKFTMGSTEKELAADYALARKSRKTLEPTWKEGMGPEHDVTLGAFYIDRHEVTEAQFHRFVADAGFKVNPDVSSGNPTYPVSRVTWDEADAYCRYHGKVLPTEAQWEMAARGGAANRRYPWGNDPLGGTRANFCDEKCTEPVRDENQNDGYATRAPVGHYEAGRSLHGVYDLAGNVAEWVRDWYDRDFYVRAPEKEPFRDTPARTEQRVVRGGSWSSDAAELRTAFRHRESPAATKDTIGFRCALEVRN